MPEVRKMILDVGCGSTPQGDVNVDPFMGFSPHHARVIDGRDYLNFVQGGLPQLPFRDKAFNVVSCRHVIEHTDNPVEAVLELRRVARKAVFLKVPNNPLHEFPLHRYTWSLVSLKNLLTPHFAAVYVYPYTNVWNSRLFHFLENRRGVVGMFCKAFSRRLRGWMGLEIAAVCIVGKL